MSEKKKDVIEGVSPEELREYKDKLIAETYYSEEKGYKSKEKTYKMAREKNALITRKDVEDWFSRNGVALKPRSFKNSYIAGYPMQEYQMDLFQMNKKSGIKDWAKLCMIMVDIFTKRTEIVPVEGKDASDLKKGIRNCCANSEGSHRCSTLTRNPRSRGRRSPNTWIKGIST